MEGLDYNALAAFAFAVLLIYLIGRLLVVPVKMIAKLLGNALAGGLLLLVFNLIGSPLGINLGVNIITALIVGMLGIPGLVMLVLIQRILG
ncbi:MAG: pro-sigmaK processing inhibitor BofA [Candidatus Syntrophonatronum acetioxidans]|uniref:Pro-sigmaK processing inhibitor BofA n=1 Tax=Candidatus Syntrophonatronum acetioxidans TaxID=1795816 RepID=A0A424Y9V6_9FIRM|nr:MAG: pro-sigmaK processing inhibitor BofA [Candidatus Syntrophonatronum acetioxidans]